MSATIVTQKHRELALSALQTTQYLTAGQVHERGNIEAIAHAFATFESELRAELAQQPSPPELQALLLRDWSTRCLDSLLTPDRELILRRGLNDEVIVYQVREGYERDDAEPISWCNFDPDAARLSAATAVFDSLPADVQAKIGARPNG